MLAKQAAAKTTWHSRHLVVRSGDKWYMEYGKNGRQFDMRFGSASKISVSPLQLRHQQHPDLISGKRGTGWPGPWPSSFSFDSISFIGGARAAAAEDEEEEELVVGEQRELVKCLQANTPHHQHNTGKGKKGKSVRESRQAKVQEKCWGEGIGASQWKKRQAGNKERVGKRG